MASKPKKPAGRKAPREPKNGRPTDLTPELQARIVALIKGGNFPTTSAAACGVAENTYFEWMARGEGRDRDRPAIQPYLGFAKAIAEARAHAEVSLVLKLREQIEGSRPHKKIPGRRVKSRISTGQVLSIQWMLSRGFSQRWGLRPDGVAIDMPPQDEGEGNGIKINVILARDDATP